MATCLLSIVANNPIALKLVASGEDMWADGAPTILANLCNVYLHQYTALPTNTQFVERGVKESRYVLLGQCDEQNRITLAIARATVLPDCLLTGHLDINDKEEEMNRYQLKGKRKTVHLMQGIFAHNEDMLKCKNAHSEQEYISGRNRVKKLLID